MWKYIKPYLGFAVLAALFMVGEVSMDLLQPDIMRKIVDDGVLGLSTGGVGDLELILRLGLTMICLVLFGGFCGSMNNAFVNLSGQNIGNDMRKDCFRKTMTFSFPQLDRFGTGSLVTRVTNDITQVQNFVSQFVRGMIRTVMLTFGSIFCMFRLDAAFGTVVLCAFPVIVAVMAFCIHKTGPLFQQLQNRLDGINGILQEDIAGIRVIKACVQEQGEKQRFGKANDGLIRTQLKVLVIYAFMNPAVQAVMYVAVAVILLVGNWQAGADGSTPGNIMAAITYTTQLLNGVLMLVMLFQNITRGLASWKRVREVLDAAPDLQDGAFAGETREQGSVEFRDVSFGYPGGPAVLEHINLKIRPGETLAILGETGCGKTSLVNLIPRFYDVSSGAVLVDGVDVREYRMQDLREKISVALQKSELFSTTIRENIAWGDLEASDAVIETAARTAQADGFIRKIPDGYGNVVAERGMSLSGGQKQRVAIARAVLKPAEILLFDDATSALDLRTEADLYEALAQSHPRSTKIIIAQRIASVRRADRIAVLEHGRIAACGTHEELMACCPAYQAIVKSQLGEEVLVHG